MDFLGSHLIMNAPLSVDHFQSSLLDGFAVAPTQKWWLELNDFLKNPYFKRLRQLQLKLDPNPDQDFLKVLSNSTKTPSPKRL